MDHPDCQRTPYAYHNGLLIRARGLLQKNTTQKRLGIDLGPRYELGESSVGAATRPIRGRRTDYGFVGTMDTEIRRRRAEKVGYGIRDVWIDPREAIEEVQGAGTQDSMLCRDTLDRPDTYETALMH
ncbi:hypothetical protein Tco_0149937 [Tanacetum coccineum]